MGSCDTIQIVRPYGQSVGNAAQIARDFGTLGRDSQMPSLTSSIVRPHSSGSRTT